MKKTFSEIAKIVSKEAAKYLFGAIALIVVLYVVFPSWFEAKTVEPDDYRFYKDGYKKLNDQLALAQTETIEDPKEFQRRVDAKIANILPGVMKHIVDSLERAGRNVTGVSTTTGELSVSGGGSTKDNAYQDPWLKAALIPGDLQYEFTFKLSEVSIQLEDRDGKQGEIFSVFFESTTMPGNIIYWGDLWRERVVLFRNSEEADSRTFYWSDWSVNADFVYREVLEAGFSVTPFTWTSGGLSPEAVILRFPEMGISTNIDDVHHVFTGVRLNVGRWIPLFSDLYIAPKYGLRFGKSATFEFLIGIGTTL